jgi:hypothetical protein
MWRPWQSELSSRELLEQAQAALAEGDTLGASEKGWLAVAQALYALADERGWEGRRFRIVPQALAYLAEEPNGREMQELFLAAYALHMNFYENFLPEETIEIALEQVQAFLEGLEQLERRGL